MDRDPAHDPEPSIADGIAHALDPRYVPLQRVVGQIVTGALSCGALVALVVTALVESIPMWGVLSLGLLWAVATVGLAWFSHAWPEVEYKYLSYTVDAIGIEIHAGVVWRTVINVPRTRVQHTDVAQGPLDRQYGLGKLVIYTAGTEHAQVTLPGLEHGRALLIRDHLLPREQADAV